MSTSLFYRVSKLISGSAHALVGKIENVAPEMVMSEAIRQMDLALDELRQELGKTIANKHIANKRLAEKNDKHVSLAEKIEDSVQSGREDLAKAGIASQLDIEAQIPVLEKAIAEFCEKEKELTSYIQALDAKKREMKEELLALSKQSNASEGSAGQTVNKVAQSQNKAEKAISHFDNIMEKQTGLVGHRHDPHNAKKLQELETFSRENRINERLAAIKSQSKAIEVT